MSWLYSENKKSVIIMDDRFVGYKNFNYLSDGIIANPNQDFRNKLVPFYVEVSSDNLISLTSEEINDWIVYHLTGWWCLSGVYGYRFQKEEDAIHFKMAWG